MTTDRKAAISVRGLAKRFGDVQAVAGVDFAVAPGELFGFLGPNGARFTIPGSRMKPSIPFQTSSSSLSAATLAELQRSSSVRLVFGTPEQR